MALLKMKGVSCASWGNGPYNANKICSAKMGANIASSNLG